MTCPSCRVRPMPPRARRFAICRDRYRAERREVGKARRDRATWHPPAWVRQADRAMVRVKREEAA